jgi:hypothetical protein
MSSWSATTAILAALVALAAPGCAGSRGGEVAPLPERMTLGALRGPLCSGQQCRCARAPKEAGLPGNASKRFEIQLGPSGEELWASVGEVKLYKSPERSIECFYVDLMPGRHRVTLRGHGEHGFGANMSIAELGPKGAWWYRTFQFECGVSVCAVDQIKVWKEWIASLGTKHDPCGSTKVLGVAYQHGRVPDGRHPNDLAVEATLEVHEFTPDKPSCPR